MKVSPDDLPPHADMGPGVDDPTPNQNSAGVSGVDDPTASHVGVLVGSSAPASKAPASEQGIPSTINPHSGCTHPSSITFPASSGTHLDLPSASTGNGGGEGNARGRRRERGRSSPRTSGIQAQAQGPGPSSSETNSYLALKQSGEAEDCCSLKAFSKAFSPSPSLTWDRCTCCTGKRITVRTPADWSDGQFPEHRANLQSFSATFWGPTCLCAPCGTEPPWVGDDTEEMRSFQTAVAADELIRTASGGAKSPPGDNEISEAATHCVAQHMPFLPLDMRDPSGELSKPRHYLHDPRPRSTTHKAHVLSIADAEYHGDSSSDDSVDDLDLEGAWYVARARGCTCPWSVHEKRLSGHVPVRRPSSHRVVIEDPGQPVVTCLQRTPQAVPVAQFNDIKVGTSPSPSPGSSFPFLEPRQGSFGHGGPPGSKTNCPLSSMHAQFDAQFDANSEASLFDANSEAGESTRFDSEARPPPPTQFDAAYVTPAQFESSLQARGVDSPVSEDLVDIAIAYLPTFRRRRAFEDLPPAFEDFRRRRARFNVDFQRSRTDHVLEHSMFEDIRTSDDNFERLVDS